MLKIFNNFHKDISTPYHFSTLFVLYRSFSPISYSTSTKWSGFSFYYSDDISPNVESFLKTLKPKNKYILFIHLMTSDNYWITLTSQLFVYSSSSIKSIVNPINQGVFSNAFKYSISFGNLIIFKYRLFSPSLSSKISKLSLSYPLRKIADIRNRYLNSKYIPMGFDISYFGTFLYTYESFSYYQLSKNVVIQREFISSTHYNNTVLLNNNVLLSFQDIYDGEWYRKLGNLNIYLSKGSIKYLSYKIPTKFIESIKPHTNSSFKFITLDIETYLDNQIFIPYSIGWFDGNNSNLYYLTDFSNHTDMILAAFNDLFIKKYHGYTVYIHNLSNFDSNFLIKPLLEKYDLNITFKDGKILQFICKTKHPSASFNDKSSPIIKLTFKDSYLIFPISLRDCCNIFNVKTFKGYFPYSFINKKTINYFGNKPDISYYPNIPIDSYDLINKYNWSTRLETLKYLKSDLYALYEFIEKLRDHIFDNYKLNISKFISLPSLAFAIFRLHFFDQAKSLLPILKGKVYNNIYKSYYGGVVDTYIPQGENLYYYDVNSLYPFAMKNPMPVGSPIYTTENDLFNLFGFFKAEITTPKYLNIPILPYRNDDGLLINPLGSWVGWYFSEELKVAVSEYGYTVKIIEGYKFDKGINVFNNYIDHFFDKKANSNGGEKLIAKLFLNSLYGRMGMKNFNTKTDIVNNHQADNILSKHKILDHQYINDDYILIKYILQPDINICNVNNVDYVNAYLEYSEKSFDFNISIGIASATTAYARMYMNTFKNMTNNPCYYSDTDSLVLKYKLPDIYVGNNLGQFKLEYNIKLGLFPAPKIYYLILNDSNNTFIKKGFNLLEINHYWNLINKSSISILKEKWFKNYKDGNMIYSKSPHNLTLTHKKRIPLYYNGEWINTKPIVVYNNKIKSTSLVIYVNKFSLIKL